MTTYIGRLHLIYLGLLPSLATFALLRVYGFAYPFVLFIVGTAATAVYLAATYSYTRLPQSLGANLFVLLDGPLFALAGWGGQTGSPWGFAIEGFLVDGTAVWLAILGLSIVSTLPTPGQRAASIGIMVAVLGVTAVVFWPYLRDNLWGHWFRTGALVAGIGEGLFVWYRLL
ncbi:MAG: hypothetical protein P8183_24395, partial [Anaerolineae bacterium]